MHAIAQKYRIRLKTLNKMNSKEREYIPEVGERLHLR